MVAFISFLIFPSFFYVVLDGTSTALGLVFALLIIFLVTVSRLRLGYSGLLRMFFILFLVSLVFFVYSFFAFGLGGYSADSRVIYSIFLLVFIISSSCFFSAYLISVPDECFRKSICLAAIFSVLIGLGSFFFEQNFLGYERYAKSVFPFAEPSHYAITLGPILFASGFLVSIKFRALLIGFSLFFSFATPSLVMLLFSILMILFYFKWSVVHVSFVGISSSVLLLILFSSEQGVYFLDRLSFSVDSKNLTALVYMQGWEDMFNALQDSNWFGIGFQNLGILSPGRYGDVIYSLAGEYKNRNDGGFLVSKIIAEFGVLGVVVILGYLFYFAKSSLFLIKYVGGGFGNCPALFIFANAIIVASLIEFFARGSGYFTPGLFIAMTSIFALTSSRKDMKGNCYE